MADSLKVAVIGAGAAGLTAARELQRESHHVVVFERSHRLGGAWVYDPRVESDLLGRDPNRDIVHGSLYKSLETNLPRELMSFSDFKFGDKTYGDPRMFPGHEEVLKFLEDFATTFDLTKLIRFNTEVIRVEPAESGMTEFVVESKAGGLNLVEVFDAVVVCNGHNTEPNLPTDIPAAIGALVPPPPRLGPSSLRRLMLGSCVVLLLLVLSLHESLNLLLKELL
uniref:Flavin-containing monooxygenase n=1 Tax=Tanacetum cinerariifolium TaxID=118510 RepID=A0A6L2L043_TANCI|nr:flavin-containing monooxygenase FMO GS-OX5-like [Tanacetum cinerariifolium]